jgi:hypothetical protein
MAFLRFLLLFSFIAAFSGGGMDPNGGTTDGGPGMDPNGGALCYTGCVDPNG